ncbi:hypothetical protein VZT92_025706 [Zoarces viviparus]|uniref:Uncharacterized protein n=1 Tax=Zoarces viviparus TaxID=48416 RepID=A0AAW1DY53_ZOAVI
MIVVDCGRTLLGADVLQCIIELKHRDSEKDGCIGRFFAAAGRTITNFCRLGAHRASVMKKDGCIGRFFAAAGRTITNFCRLGAHRASVMKKDGCIGRFFAAVGRTITNFRRLGAKVGVM